MELVLLVPTFSATNIEIQGQVSPELIETTVLMIFDGNSKSSIITTRGGTCKCTRSAGETGVCSNPLYDECAVGQEIPTLACNAAVLKRVAGASIYYARLSDQNDSGRENCLTFTPATTNDGFSCVYNGRTDNTGNDCYPQEDEEERTSKNLHEFENSLQISLSEKLNEPNYLRM
ncbi:unnamed protein product [Allacma fusca]|uniref:Uncharacterized protein n=1 Tax=Allacma fusca TaxID=39272 RepID=A0A8J2J1F9_9HEXA|nr:unnamed protein product [Allacma fusca]